jgi:hypothetical protein
MQPTYFPWAGYFNLIAQVDVFVFLDDVQYERGSWQNRNRVLIKGEPHWLTVPVVRQFLGETINAVRTEEKHAWRHKHLALLMQTYGKHPYGREMLEVAGRLSDANLNVLADLNIRLILDVCGRLGLSTPTLRSSELAIEGRRTGRLIDILDHFGCDEYLSPVGATDYLAEDGFSNRTHTRLMFQNYVPAPYPQKGGREFIGHLSILDVAASIGWTESARYVGTM